MQYSHHTVHGTGQVCQHNTMCLILRKLLMSFLFQIRLPLLVSIDTLRTIPHPTITTADLISCSCAILPPFGETLTFKNTITIATATQTITKVTMTRVKVMRKVKVTILKVNTKVEDIFLVMTFQGQIMVTLPLTQITI